ncbi:hypothetical protein ACFQGE_01535 [Halomicroarcula sp. GCM10025817]|uniref:hypothetical protein n=1 Tax=Haloarcula TaxID=2237 RepID=UPI0023E89971|nr:hypothetical protein [Halomicroarcula sp. SYNS111]
MPFETPPLVPADVAVPDRLETDAFVVRPLTIEDAEMDYEAVTTSRERLRGTFGPADAWPEPDLTLGQNRIDLAWHQKEHQRRDAFTYAVVDPDETVELGCVYVQPTRVDGYDAAVYYWTSATAFTRGLDAAIEEAVREWVETDWPFESVAYPGRDLAWVDFPPATDGT